MPNINNMTREEFGNLPYYHNLPDCNWSDEIKCDNLVIVPAKEEEELHDSGYRAMSFAPVIDNGAEYLISGCSDVIHIDGIGGYGNELVGSDWYTASEMPKKIHPKAWAIDCLPASGLLRIFSRYKLLCIDITLSSFNVYSLYDRNMR